MALNLIIDGDIIVLNKYKTIYFSNIAGSHLIDIINWCDNKELYFYAYDGETEFFKLLKKIKINPNTNCNLYVRYKDETHPDVVEFKLTWL